MSKFTDSIENMISEMVDLFGHLPIEEREDKIENHEQFIYEIDELHCEVWTGWACYPYELDTEPSYSNLEQMTEWAIGEGFEPDEILESIGSKYSQFSWYFTMEAQDYLEETYGENIVIYCDTERDMLDCFAKCVAAEIYDVFDCVEFEFTEEVRDAFREGPEQQAIDEYADAETAEHRREILDAIHYRSEQKLAA